MSNKTIDKIIDVGFLVGYLLSCFGVVAAFYNLSMNIGIGKHCTDVIIFDSFIAALMAGLAVMFGILWRDMDVTD